MGRDPGGAELAAGCRVLIVADAFLTAELIARILTAWGCTILGPVARADDALEQIDSDRAPDVVLLDLDLRGRPGARLAAALKARGVPVVLVTGHGRTVGVKPPWRGAPRVAKPFDAEQLVRAVAQAVHGRG